MTTHLKLNTRTLRSWSAIEDEYNTLLDEEQGGGEGVWNFRGQRDHTWSLTSSLERAFETFNIDANDRLEREEVLIREFKRYYHLYSSFIPPSEDDLTYLTLMQHYGTPTRLLDFTYSFFVALYFAVDGMSVGGNGCAVIAMNRPLINKKAIALLGGFSPNGYDRHFQKLDTFRKTFLQRNAKRFIYPLNAYRLNERSAIQQGFFVCQGDIRCSFEENLSESVGKRPDRNLLRKYVIPADSKLKREIMYRLHRMNISSATLYPGLPGFAQSLASRVWMYEVK